MRKQLHEIIRNFEDITEQIGDVKTIFTLYEEKLRESGIEPTTQSILRTELKLVNRLETDCEQLDEKWELFYVIIYIA